MGADHAGDLYDQVWYARAGGTTNHVSGAEVLKQALMSGGGGSDSCLIDSSSGEKKKMLLRWMSEQAQACPDMRMRTAISVD